MKYQMRYATANTTVTGPKNLYKINASIRNLKKSKPLLFALVEDWFRKYRINDAAEIIDSKGPRKLGKKQGSMINIIKLYLKILKYV